MRSFEQDGETELFNDTGHLCHEPQLSVLLQTNHQITKATVGMVISLVTVEGHITGSTGVHMWLCMCMAEHVHIYHSGDLTDIHEHKI